MSPKRSTQSPHSELIHDRVSPSELYFDPQNPRLVEYIGDGEPSQKELLAVLWRQMAVDELAMSIASSGYFDYEPLFVTEEKGKLIVIEGNRRLAAVKLLIDPALREELRATDLPKLTPTVAASLKELPVIRTTRKEAWQYLGFKHVNGPAKWDSYAKAQYIATVRDTFKVSLEDIARQIGDKHKTVQRLYRALGVIAQAEREGVFDRENRYKSHFSFSHLYTGLDYEGISEFISLKDDAEESQTPVPKSHRKELGELCTWLFGDKSLEIPPKIESQNPHLRQLDEVLKSERLSEKIGLVLLSQAAAAGLWSR